MGPRFCTSEARLLLSVGYPMFDTLGKVGWVAVFPRNADAPVGRYRHRRISDAWEWCQSVSTAVHDQQHFGGGMIYWFERSQACLWFVVTDCFRRSPMFGIRCSPTFFETIIKL